MIREPAVFDAFLARVRRFVREIAIPAEEEVERSGAIPEPILEAMRNDGYFGWSIPAEHGGAGLTTEELVLAAFELSQCAVAFRARVGTNTGIGSEAIVADGTEEQKRRYLPRLATGEWTGCLAVTEPDAGSEASNVRTTAVRDGQFYILDGEKCFITNAPLAHVFTVTARTDPRSTGATGVSAFVVERDMRGLSTGTPYRKMGQVGSPVSAVHFNACRVPAAQLIGSREGAGFKTIMKVLNKQRSISLLCRRGRRSGCSTWRSATRAVAFSSGSPLRTISSCRR
jgi:acyl-CoA dehydrogenase